MRHRFDIARDQRCDIRAPLGASLGCHQRRAPAAPRAARRGGTLLAAVARPTPPQPGPSRALPPPPDCGTPAPPCVFCGPGRSARQRCELRPQNGELRPRYGELRPRNGELRPKPLKSIPQTPRIDPPKPSNRPPKPLESALKTPRIDPPNPSNRPPKARQAPPLDTASARTCRR
eukprot:1187544-Prorocentrum_minimum.AAC.1